LKAAGLERFGVTRNLFMTVTSALLRRPILGATLALLPGVGLSVVIALLAHGAEPHVAAFVPIPAMVIALLIGIALNPVAARPSMQAGMDYCIKTILRWSVALLGLRIELADIAALGVSSAIIVIVSMAATIVCGFMFARLARQPAAFGALIGVGTAVCGASATLAVSTVIPDYKNKPADIAFVIVTLNALATAAMLVYPPLCVLLGLDAQATGIMLGGTIHDVAQVAGAGYAVSPDVGNAAVIVKLFRVFLLLPTVVAVGFYFSRLGLRHGEARVPMPGFAIVFLILCLLNSAIPLLPDLMPFYRPVRAILIDASTWGLLLAIAALGLGTSIKTIVGLGWRHAATIVGTTVVILAIVTGGLILIDLL
jgi:uncharacterized integral membrane protein (TIGR00698 family)